jgi:hypothetical protein
VIINTIFFKECKFENTLTFEDISFTREGKSRIDFERSKLPDTISFITNRLYQDTYVNLDLTTADLSGREEKPILVSFKNFDISKVKFDYKHFKLLFSDTISQDEKESLYEALLNNFRSRGQLESYQLADIDYRTVKLREHWYTHPLIWLNLSWWNYGYSKSYIFLWTALFLLIFTPVTYKKLGYLNDEVYTMANIPKVNDIHRKADLWWYSFIYTTSIFFKITLKMENLKFTDKRWTAYIILVYTLGVVCLAYMANFVLQK